MRYLLLIAFALGSFKSFASHIVGGEMVYDYLGNDSFKVSMQYYIDCEYGIPRAIADDSTVFFSIFNNDTFVLNREVRISDTTRLKEYNYTCIKSYGNACVEMFYFETIFYLPPINGGYDIYFQRCCRNHTILNIIKPEETGATFSTHIPEFNAEISYNSSPRFNKLPPNYLCAGEYFNFDHSATDPDSDSLFYRFYNPLDGHKDEIRPKIATKPVPVKWSNGYSDTNQLLVKDSLYLNSLTGRLVFTPRVLGQFVFGIAVDEYRNDSLIGTTFRDYQFNVVRCNHEIGADFYLPPVTCANNILLESFVTNGTDYKWFVDDELIANQWSILRQFPDTGEFNIKLVVYDGNCKDSTSKSINVIKDSFSFGIDTFGVCDINSVILSTFLDTSGVYDWKINGNWQPLSKNSVIHEPVVYGKHWVHIKLPECHLFDTFWIEDRVPIFDLNIPNTICNDTLKLNIPEGKYDNYEINTQNAELITEGVDHPLIILNDTGIFHFSVTVGYKGCNRTFNYVTDNDANGTIDSFKYDLCKNDSLTIEATYFENANYNWTNRPTTLQHDSLQIYAGIIQQSANFWVEIETDYGCVYTNQFDVTAFNPSASFEWRLDTSCTGFDLSITDLSKGDSIAWKLNREVFDLPENHVIDNLAFNTNYKLDVLAFEKMCADSFTQSFNVNQTTNFNYRYPNVITPNNDGLNDCFLVEADQNRNCGNYKFWVFNRWGEMLYKSETENEIPCWNGTNMANEQLVSQGTYFFILEIENQRFNGTITVLY